ncbi:MAG: bacterioferritin [Phycisphaerae bacterium]
MKGNDKLIAVLNDLLADELTAISQYMVHSEMCDAWGYEALHKSVEARAIVEMKHAEKLIGRILFLEGTPQVDKLKKMLIGSDVPKQFANDLEAEIGAWQAYNDAIKLANDVGDAPTKHLLEEIVRDEDAHIDDLEEKQDQIKQMGVQLFLANQVDA